MQVRPGTVVRGAGVALACLASNPGARTRVLFASFAMGWPLNRPGLQAVIVLPDTAEPWKRAALPFAASVTSWSTVMFVATTAARQIKLPKPLAAVMLGATVVVVDSLLADRQERIEARPAATTAESDDADEPTDG